MPKNAAGVFGRKGCRDLKRKIFHALGVEMNFAVVIASETLKDFREGAFRAVAPVNKRGHNGETQVNAPRSVGEPVPPGWSRTVRRQQESVGGTGHQAATIDKHSARSLRRLLAQ